MWFSPRVMLSEIAGIKKAGPNEPAPPALSVTLLLTNLQIVLHTEGAEHAVGPDTRDVAIHLVCNEPFQPHMTVFHEDVDRRIRELRITGREYRRAVDRAIDGQTDTVVIRRERQNFDVIDDSIDAFHVAYGILCIGLDDRPVDFAGEDHGVAIQPERDIVKHGVPRHHR